MWLFTRYGFVSTVAHRGKKERQKGLMILRFRAEQDARVFRSLVMEKLSEREREGLTRRPKISRLEGADYAYRFMLPRNTWLALLRFLGDDVRYTNFKDAALEFQHTRKELGEPYNERLEMSRQGVYFNIWHQMRHLQFAEKGHVIP